jgi:hypothetical protein
MRCMNTLTGYKYSFYVPTLFLHIRFGQCADPEPVPQDPYVFGPPGSKSGSVSTRYGSGSGSFYNQAKLVFKKNLNSYCFLTSLWLVIEKLCKFSFNLVVILKVTGGNTRIRSRTRYSEVWIRGSVSLPNCHGSAFRKTAFGTVFRALWRHVWSDCGAFLEVRRCPEVKYPNFFFQVTRRRSSSVWSLSTSQCRVWETVARNEKDVSCE